MGRLIDANALEDRFSLNCGGECAVCSYNNTLCDIITEAPTVEAIPKSEYENRLKADMIAMLTEIQWEIAEMKSYESPDGQDLVMLADIGILFQQKISALRGDTNEPT